MKSIHRLVPCLLLFLAAAWPAHSSRADIVMTAQETKSDVVFKFSGSIKLTGLGEASPASVRGQVQSASSIVEFGPGASVADAADWYVFVIQPSDSPSNFGTGGAKTAASHSGSYFSIQKNAIKLPKGYTSESQIAGTMTFPGSTFAGMGINAAGGPCVWILVNDQKVTLNFLAKVGNSAKIKALQKKAKKLKKRILKAKRDRKPALLKKLRKQLRQTNAQIRRLK